MEGVIARNGSGTYARTHADYVAGAVILKDDINGELNDIATALTQSVSKDGQTTLTGNIPAGGFKLTGLGAGSAATDSVHARQAQSNALAFATCTGTNTIALTVAPAIAAYTDGLRVSFNAANTNTGSATANVSAVGAFTITWPNQAVLAAGDIKQNATTVIEWNATATKWHLISVHDPVKEHTLTGKGDIYAYNASGVVGRHAAGTNGSVLMARSASTTGIEYVAALSNAIWGLTYQNNATDATNDIDIAPGGCMDTTGAEWIQLAALTKRIDAAWTVGTNQGWLDTGALADSDYYIWAIKRSDTGVTDSLCSLSSTAPTMPANYDYKRLIGWIKRVGGAIVAFKTYEIEGGGLHFQWAAPSLDIDLAATLTTTRRTDAVKTPQNVATYAILNVNVYDAAAAFVAWLYCPDQDDTGPASLTAGPLSNFGSAPTGGTLGVGQVEIRTSATGTIAAEASIVTVDQYSVSTLGFKWPRR